MGKLKIISSFNAWVVALFFYFVNRVLSHIPFHVIRNIFYYRLLGKCGKNNTFLMGLELRKPSNISMGSNNIVNRNVMLDGRGGKLTIGSNVDIAQETNIWTLEHDVHDDYHKDLGADVIIEDYVWIASRVTILPGVTIGKGAVVASNSVVTKNVEPMNIIGGIPAKKIGMRKSGLKYFLNHRPLFQ
ncbi:MAG: acyltransferase [Flavobacteriaceae bacterium]|nr:MAG: acyltransferase [Flavobacteriaceae bacterium]